MQGTTDKAPIPMEHERDGGRMSVHRKFADLLQYFNPFSTMPSPPSQDKDMPVRKRPRLEGASTGVTVSNAEDTDIFVDAQTYQYMADDTLVALPDDTVAVGPTDAVVTVTDVAASLLPNTEAFRARAPPRKWKPTEDAKLMDAVTKLGVEDWVQVAALVPARSNDQCRHRWVNHLDVDNMNNSGRWTLQEDAKLAVAVTECGNEWVRVATLVPGRTNEQCRCRWDKILNSLDPDIIPAVPVTVTVSATATVSAKVHVPSTKALRASALQLRPRNNCWTVEENAQLTAVVKELGNDWVRIAGLLPGRTNTQCRLRWRKHLHLTSATMTNADTGTDTGTLTASPDDDTGTVSLCVAPTVAAATVAAVLRRVWTQDEDAMLNEAVKTLCEDWDSIAMLFPGRTNVQCSNRWFMILDPTIDRTTAHDSAKGRWKVEEDAKLMDAVRIHGGRNWKAITALVPGRTDLQCRTRWFKSLRPDIDQTNSTTCSKGNWNETEDRMLTDAVKKHGKNWAAVSALIPNRTDNQCCRRWHWHERLCSIDPTTKLAMIKTGKWTPEEDQTLAGAVEIHGDQDWNVIEALVAGRTLDQCRHRWSQSLDPTIDRTVVRARGKWTVEEDAKLTAAVAECGHEWGRVAALVKSRTKKNCMNRWHMYLAPLTTATSINRWTAEEDAMLTVAVKKHGNIWVRVAALIPNRTNDQCRKRWAKSLNPERSTRKKKC
jgi:hypothetical protein